LSANNQLRLHDWDSILDEGRNFSSCQYIHTGFRSYPVFCLRGTREYLPGIKHPGIVKIQSEQSFNSTAPKHFDGVELSPKEFLPVFIVLHAIPFTMR
jgi:hypothetical protein